jgi:CHAD domain-containing protein
MGHAWGCLRPGRKDRPRLYRQLQRSLRSARYRQFIEALTKRANLPDHDTNEPALAAGFAAQRLERWRRKLIKRGRRLGRLGEAKRHRLRLRAKRYRYALEWSLPLLTKPPALTREEIRQAKVIQDALGPLNDSFTHQAQAKALKIDPLPAMVRLGREKPQARRLRTAGRAVRKLARLH